MTVSLAIFLFAAILMTAIGVSQIKSQTPVGFYSGEDIPGGVPGIVSMCLGMFIPLPLMALYHKKLKRTYYRK